MRGWTLTFVLAVAFASITLLSPKIQTKYDLQIVIKLSAGSFTNLFKKTAKVTSLRTCDSRPKYTMNNFKSTEQKQSTFSLATSFFNFVLYYHPNGCQVCGSNYPKEHFPNKKDSPMFAIHMCKQIASFNVKLTVTEFFLQGIGKTDLYLYIISNMYLVCIWMEQLDPEVRCT